MTANYFGWRGGKVVFFNGTTAPTRHDTVLGAIMRLKWWDMPSKVDSH